MTLLLASIIDVAIVIALGLAATALLARRSAALRHWILAGTIAAAGLMPCLELVLPVWNLPQLPSPVSSTSVVVTIDSVQPASAAALPTASGILAGGLVPRWDVVLVTIWTGGLMVALVVLGAGMVKLRALIRRATRVTDIAWQRIATEIARGYGLRREVRLLYTSHATPVSLGWLRPTILLPFDARDWDRERIRVVLQHELAHVARRDWPVQMVAAILCCVHWFNPLMWVAYRALRRESERACDDLVLKSGVEAADYATHLLAMARHAGAQATVWSPATAIAHASMLEERIKAMLNSRLDREPVTMRARLAAVAVLAILFLPIAAFTSESPVPGPISAARNAKQTAPGSIAGVLYDQHNGLLPDAEISLTEDRTGTTLTARSDQSGAFAFRDLPPGDYTLVTALNGFARVRNLIRLASGASVKRNILLPLGQIQETVSVVSDGSVPRARAKSSTATTLARQIPEPRVPSPCVGRIGGCIKTPRKVIDVKPVYPPGLAAAGVGGEVVLNGRVGLDGYMSDLRVVDIPSPAGAPHPDLVTAALEAVRQWEFDPTLLNGVPVEASVTITVRFNTR